MSDAPGNSHNSVPYFAALIGSIASGELHCDPQSLSKLAERGSEFIDRLRVLRDRFADDGDRRSGWGQLPSGRAIAQHFADKEAEMVSILDQHIAIVERMEAFFVSTRESYLSTEAANSAPFQFGSFGPT
ncbi:hypothetical protein [Hoyosella altamirensis]|uniref:hypothetical protein n=1 Tax=Hoyosella altamirensis TaxID=616997 RepID=UPI0007DB14B9|nr:hypothetical protein [Hoyosella altamirensis]